MLKNLDPPVIIGIIIDNLHLKTATIIPPQQLACIPQVFDLTVTKMNIGLKYLTCPGAFVQYKNIPGAKGKVLGIWSVLIQAIPFYHFTECWIIFLTYTKGNILLLWIRGT